MISFPNKFYLQDKPTNEKELILWLSTKSNHNVRISYPQKGEKAKELRITFQNAKLLLGEWIFKKAKKKRQAIPKTIQKLRFDLSLEKFYQKGLKLLTFHT